MKVMKKLAIACIAVMVLLTVSCGGDSPSNSNPASFLRTSSDGYNEIFFDNFTSEVSNTSMIAVLRKEADEEYWTYAFWIYQNYNVDHLENIPPLKDYYATSGKTYTYQIQFSDTDYSGEVQITTNKSLGDVTVTPGTVEFNQSTGKLEFSTLPVFHYTPAGSFFDECNESIVYSYPCNDYSSYASFDIGDIENNKYDVYNYINNNYYRDKMIGKNFTPYGYSLGYVKNSPNHTIFMDVYVSNAEGLPCMAIPEEL